VTGSPATPCLDVRHLRLVAAIADAGSVTRAAERLNLTQSAESHQLRELEDRLQAPMFLRAGRRMVLAPAGRRLLETAQRVLPELGIAEDEVRRIGDEGAAALRLCAQCNTGYHWLPPLLKRFHRDYPKVDVQVLAEHTARPVQALYEGALDLALLTDPDPDPRLSIRPLFEDEYVVLVARSHRLAARRWIAPAELAPEHLILYSPTRERGFTARRILEPARVAPARMSYIQLTEAILEMVKAGIGVTALPRWSVEPAIQSGSVVALRVTRRGIQRRWAAATLVGRRDLPWLDDFLSLLRLEAAPVRPRRVS
jgi:LysR family transcriptional regulator for metE and metH